MDRYVLATPGASYFFKEFKINDKFVMTGNPKEAWLFHRGYEDNDHHLRRYWAKTDNEDVFQVMFFVDRVDELTYEYCQKQDMLLTSEEVERLKAIQGEPYTTLIDQVKIKFESEEVK